MDFSFPDTDSLRSQLEELLALLQAPPEGEPSMPLEDIDLEEAVRIIEAGAAEARAQGSAARRDQAPQAGPSPLIVPTPPSSTPELSNSGDSTPAESPPIATPSSSHHGQVLSAPRPCAYPNCHFAIPAYGLHEHYLWHQGLFQQPHPHASNLPPVPGPTAHHPYPPAIQPAQFHPSPGQGPFTPIVFHPAAPNWPHLLDVFIAVPSPTEDLVRLCVVVPCALLGCPHVCPAQDMGAHFISHFAGRDGDEIMCAWPGCGAKLKWQSWKAHVDQLHLKVRVQHCPYCHRDRRAGAKDGHVAADCPKRAAALKGEKLPQMLRAGCSFWCNVQHPPEAVPQYGFPHLHKYQACIVGPLRLPQGPPA